jgi:hypothetical protein
VDRIAKTFPGFYIGRFDVRFSDVERFKAGEDLTVIELNGVTSESTNIYDPNGSIWRAYRVLFRQWSTLFQIGAMNRAGGLEIGDWTQFLTVWWRNWRNPQPVALSD